MLPDYSTAQYQLVIMPHESVLQEIMQLRKMFAEKFEATEAVRTKPDIVLLRFEQYEMIEPHIFRRLAVWASAQETFQVELDGFGSLPTHSIYLHIQTKNIIQAMVKGLRPMQQLLKIDAERKPHFILDPHILLAHKLLPWQYEKGWLEMSHTPFSARFMAAQVCLLRRRDGEKKFTTMKKFAFQNLKQECVQGALFL